MQTKGTKTIHSILIVEVCPNEDDHEKERVNKAKSDTTQYFTNAFAFGKRPHHFCPKRGARYITKQIRQNSLICKNCGGKIYYSDAYCPNCGNQLL